MQYLVNNVMKRCEHRDKCRSYKRNKSPLCFWKDTYRQSKHTHEQPLLPHIHLGKSL
jgi:hypothetical protein